MSSRRTLRGMDVEVCLADASRKQAFVTPMFDIVAPRYDSFTRLFSFGMDAHWKRQMVDDLSPLRGANAIALDLACGTGDLAFAVAKTLGPEGRVTGIDASPEMITRAEQRRGRAVTGARVRFALGDMMRLDLADASVDVVTAGYALRNVPDFRAALREIARVLRPAGTLLTLDFYRPEPAVWRELFLAYLAAAGNLIGWAWHGEGVVYGYIARSIRHFVSWQRFSDELASAGFVVEHVWCKLLGGVAIHRARRLETLVDG